MWLLAAVSLIITKNRGFNVELIYSAENYYDAILRMAYEKYVSELSNHIDLPKKSMKKFDDFFKPQVQDMKCIVAIEQDQCMGFLAYQEYEANNEIWCNIPVWGYGAENQKIMSMIFVHLANQIVTDKTTNFSVRLYASDIEIQRLFSYMQFGMISEKAVRKIEKIQSVRYDSIRLITKDEVGKRWDELWYVLDLLIDHLKQSPVFYPCEEFTESVYQEFFTDENTMVYVAEDHHKIIGLMQANNDSYNLLFSENASINVGEAFVLPEYRDSKTAQALLAYLEQDLLKKGVEYDWVEHGTANPNARGFWNKYFETVEYEFIRKIER